MRGTMQYDQSPATRREFEVALNEPLLTFAQLARRLSRQQSGRKTAASTCWRWHRVGVLAAGGNRVRLPAIRLGGAYYTSLRAAQWFFRELARQPSSDAPRVRRETADPSAVERVANRLGVKRPNAGSDATGPAGVTGGEKTGDLQESD